MKKKHLKDLWEYIAVLETIGEVQPIGKKVDLFLEAGAINKTFLWFTRSGAAFQKIRI